MIGNNNNIMEIEDLRPFSNSLLSLLDDKDRKKKIISLLLQVLNRMGYDEAVKQLEQESGVYLQDLAIKEFKSRLHQKKYLKILENLNELQLKQEVISQLYVELTGLQLSKMLESNQLQNALMFVSNSNLSEEKKAQYFQMIGLGQILSKQDCQRKHTQIQNLIVVQPIDLKGLNKLIMNYINDENGNKKNTFNAPSPPNFVTHSSEKMFEPTQVHFIKFNKDGKKILTISQGESRYELSLWEYQIKRIVRKNSVYINTKIEVIGVKWFQDEDEEMIAVGTAECIMLFSLYLNQIERIEMEDYGQLICFNYHPSREILYAGGLFNRLVGFDMHGDEVDSIQLFSKTRQFVFTKKDLMISISATKSVLTSYNMSGHYTLKQFTGNAAFMDLKLNSQETQVITCNQQFVYILDLESLEVVQKFNSPSNPNRYKIEVFFCDPWIIIFNCACIGWLTGQGNINYNWAKFNCIDVHSRILISCQKQIKLWQPDETIIERQQFESDQGSITLAQRRIWSDHNSEEQDLIPIRQ